MCLRRKERKEEKKEEGRLAERKEGRKAGVAYVVLRVVVHVGQGQEEAHDVSSPVQNTQVKQAASPLHGQHVWRQLGYTLDEALLLV